MSQTSWIKLAQVLKVTKDLDFAVKFTAKSVFLSKNIDRLIGFELVLVPPLLDFPRQLTVDSVLHDSKSVKLKFKENIPIDDVSSFHNRFLLIKQSDALEVFSDVAFFDLAQDKMIGKEVIDINIGNLGKVVGIAGADTQKHLIVQSSEDDSEILIPCVPEIILSTYEYIEVNCPEGLIEINR